MSAEREVVPEHLTGEDISVYKSAVVTEGVYFETEDGEGFTIKAGALLQALHNLGFDVQGWLPKATLHDLVTDLLRSTTSMVQPERAEKIIELVQGFKP